MSGIPAWASSGRKVVCIAVPDSGTHDSFGGDYPEPGRIYTVNRAGWSAEDALPIISLVEVPLYGANGEMGHEVRFFRPAVEPKTEAEDLALFRHHITNRQGVDA